MGACISFWGKGPRKILTVILPAQGAGASLLKSFGAFGRRVLYGFQRGSQGFDKAVRIEIWLQG